MTDAAARVEWARTLNNDTLVETGSGARRARFAALNTESRAVLMALCALPMRPAGNSWGGEVLFRLDALAEDLRQSRDRVHRWLEVLNAARIIRHLERQTNDVWQAVVVLPVRLLPDDVEVVAS